MKINVLAFAQLKTDLGFSQKEYVAEVESISLGDLAKRIFEESLAGANPDNIRLALNEEFVSPDTLLKDNDIVALIPPVSGG
ncbi:MAG: molybdopterin converting factor small subunit [Candidatus Omnitrophota bacterium]|jgi:molybdopterin converting factor small subunit